MKGTQILRTAVLALVATIVRPALRAASSGPASGADPLAIPEVSEDEVICFALYTVHDRILKLTAQLYPLDADAPRTVRLEAQLGSDWGEVAATEVVNPGWTAPFRVEPWDDSRDVPYRVRHGDSAVYAGTIRRNPRDKPEIVVAAFTGNSIYPGHGGDISKADIVENLRRIDPDLLFFSGDQVYDHNRHYAYWLKFGRDFGDAIRDRPTVTIPDDHDVGHPNLWGSGGKQSLVAAGHDGGYFKPVEYVREVERAQTSHLPDPFDPTPVARGIGVYYTALNWGGISFAILEDRKFKTGPEGIVPKLGPRPDHVTDPDYDPATLDVPGAELLGERQLAFLRTWAADCFGVVRFRKQARTITMECWPRNVDVSDPSARQYPGWPKTIQQLDNYGRKAAAFLPMLRVSGTDAPVVQVVDESAGEIIYTVRIRGREFRPMVFREGAYTIHVTSRTGATKTVTGVESLGPNEERELPIQFD